MTVEVEKTITINFTNTCIQTNEKGDVIRSEDETFVVNNFDSVKSTNEPLECTCCGREWAYIRFKSETSNGKYLPDPMRLHYAVELANYIIKNGKEKTDYKNRHELMGRIVDPEIDGMGSAQNKKGANSLDATSFTLWVNGVITDDFTFIRELRAMNHDFGYIAHCCYQDLLKTHTKEELEEVGICSPKCLKLLIGEYDNNEFMIKWFKIAAAKLATFNV